MSISRARPEGSPILSLILCSRNDAYMGNSRWRLETALNYTASRVEAVGGSNAVEIIVADWGSDVPLSDVVTLGSAARRLVSFVHVPPELARSHQRDSPFPEVLALNAAARRSRGQYIGRVDQDTLVGDRFFGWVLSGAPSPRTLYFANRTNVPYRLAALCPPLPVVERFIAMFRRWLTVETGRVFYHLSVGLWMVHRDLWDECGGYDERLIYMNDMEIDMAGRLMMRYPLVDLATITGYDFYHLDHYHPRGSRSSSTHRQVNQHASLPSRGYHPNDDVWGLARHTLPLLRARERRSAAELHAATQAAMFAWMSTRVTLRTAIDTMVYPFYPKWKRRGVVAWAAIQREPLLHWPRVLRRLWVERPAARGIVMR